MALRLSMLLKLQSCGSNRTVLLGVVYTLSLALNPMSLR